MNNKTWGQEVKEINAQFRYERLLTITRDLYKLIFDYQNPGYKWTSNEYNLMFAQLNKLCKEYDSKDWRDSELLTIDHKIKPIIENANYDWLIMQGFTR